MVNKCKKNMKLRLDEINDNPPQTLNITPHFSRTATGKMSSSWELEPYFEQILHEFYHFLKGKYQIASFLRQKFHPPCSLMAFNIERLHFGFKNLHPKFFHRIIFPHPPQIISTPEGGLWPKK